MPTFYGNRFDGTGFRPGILLFFLLVVIIFVAAVFIFVQIFLRGRGGARPFSPTHQPPPQNQPPSATQILDERFARGEIDEDEYRRRRAALSESR